ncbi:glycosyltransferase family 4 protein [Glutamicibacter ardleyensis]|uniref:glycosyltransferase family 4 protein n=1 Tax=Glutamicibacter ardleyensis TaxID=225894 RepID=UPI003FD303CB
MKILVYPHDMNMGGSQLNAIELAAAVKDLGHTVIIAGQNGSLVGKVEDLGVEFIELPDPGRRPSPRVIEALERIAIEHEIDIIHGYEWPPSLEAEIACLRLDSVAVSTVLSMSVAPFIPVSTPLLVGTEQIASTERTFGRSEVALMEPPIDTVLNRPGLELPVDLMSDLWGIHGHGLTIAIVSRLAHEMKLEGILAAIEVVGNMRGSVPVQLVITGNGPAVEVVEAAVAEANLRAGELRVVMTGELEDPRWVYAKADIVLGMGGSILRAMAFGKPVIVQGEAGFWQVLNQNSLKDFLWQGWYGAGSGSEQGEKALVQQLRPLIEDAALRSTLGKLSLSVVTERFSLVASARRQIDFYNQVLKTRERRKFTLDHAFAAARFAQYKAARLGARIRGTSTADDFNAKATLGTKNAVTTSQVRA